MPAMADRGCGWWVWRLAKDLSASLLGTRGEVVERVTLSGSLDWFSKTGIPDF